MKKIILVLIFLFGFIQNSFAETLIEDGGFESIYNFIDNDSNLVLIPRFSTNNIKIFSNSGTTYTTKSPDYTINTRTLNSSAAKGYIVFDNTNFLIFIKFNGLVTTGVTDRVMEMFVYQKNTQQYYYTSMGTASSQNQCMALSDGIFIFGNNCTNDYYYIDFSMIFNPDFGIGAGFGYSTNPIVVTSPLYLPVNINNVSFRQFVIDANNNLLSCSVQSNKYNQYRWINNFANANHNSIVIDTIDFDFGNLCTINYDSMSNIASFSYFNQTSKILNSKVFIPGVGFQGYKERYIDRLENSGTGVIIKGFQNKSGTLYRDINGGSTNSQISVVRDYINNNNPYYYKQDTLNSGCVNANYCIYVNVGENPIIAPPSTGSGNIINNSDVTVNLSPNINNINNNNVDVNIPTDSITNSGAINTTEFGTGTIEGIIGGGVSIGNELGLSGLFNNTITGSTNKSNNCSNIIVGGVFQYSIGKNNNFFQLKLENIDTQKMLGEANGWKLEFFGVNFLKPLYGILDFFGNFAVKIYNYIIKSIEGIIDLFGYIFNNIERNKYYCFLGEEYFIFTQSTQYKSLLDNTMKNNNGLIDIIVIIGAIITNLILLIKLKRG